MRVMPSLGSNCLLACGCPAPQDFHHLKQGSLVVRNSKGPFREDSSENAFFFRTTFKEFAEKYGRDQRFRLVQKRKDQERFFNQFILILKKRDKENRLRLRKMR